MPIGENLQRIRKQNQLSQEELAEMLGGEQTGRVKMGARGWVSWSRQATASVKKTEYLTGQLAGRRKHAGFVRGWQTYRYDQNDFTA